MTGLRYILAVAAIASAAALVAADDTTGAATDAAPAAAAPSPASPVAATPAETATAASGKACPPVAGPAQTAPLQMTVELLDPRDAPLLLQLTITPGEPFRKFKMDGAQSYTISGELTDLTEGRYELTVTVRHWRTEKARPTFTTTLQLTANTPRTWVRFPRGTRYRQVVTILDPSRPSPQDQPGDDQADADSDSDTDADLPDPDDAAVTEDQPGTSEAWQVATEIAPQAEDEPEGKLVYVSPWNKLIVQLAGDDEKRLEVEINFVIEEKDWLDMQALLYSQRDALRLDIETYLMGQESDELYGGENLDRISRTVLEMSNRNLFGHHPAKIREVLLVEYTIR